MRFTKAPISTKALFYGDLIYGCCQVKGPPVVWVSHFHILISKVILVNSCKRALSSGIFVDKHSIPALEAMLIKTSVAIFLSFAMSPNWSNKFLNLDLYCKVVMAATGRVGFSSSSSPRSAQITTATTPFPWWFGSGFL